MSRGADLEVTDSHGHTPVTFAASTGQTNPEIYDLFQEYGVNLEKETDQHGANVLLLSAPYLNNVSEMDYFLSKGLELSSTDKEGNGIFNYAARNGNMELLQQLVDRGVSYRQLNDEGGNAFIFAAQGSRGHSNSVEVYEYLKELGLDPAIVTNSGNTPLHRIAFSADKDIVNFFLKSGAKADQEDSEGNTPFLNAASRNSVEVVKLLAEDVKDLDQSNLEGQTPLMLAVKHNQPAVVEYLLNAGAKTHINDSSGNTLAYYLFTSGNKAEDLQKKKQLLQQYEVQLNSRQSNGNNFYHIATEANDLELLQSLSSLEADINLKNDEGLTPLHIAAMKAENDHILKYLISRGADPSLKTDFEESVYQLASENELLKKNKVELNFLK